MNRTRPSRRMAHHACGCGHQHTPAAPPAPAGPTTIDVPPETADWLRATLAADGKAGQAIRIRVVPSGCMGGRGHSYAIETAEGPEEGDRVHEAGGLSFLTDPQSDRLLGEIRIGHVADESGAGMTFHNGHAVGTCPCGHHDLFPEQG